MKTNQSNKAVTCATLANGAQLASIISKAVIEGHTSTTYAGEKMDENQIISLAQSFFHTEILNKIGVK